MKCAAFRFNPEQNEKPDLKNDGVELNYAAGTAS